MISALQILLDMDRRQTRSRMPALWSETAMAECYCPDCYCELCDTDNHRCPGCGEPVEHYETECHGCIQEEQIRNVIILGISRPRLYKRDDVWHVAFRTLKADTTEPGIYKDTGSWSDLPVSSHETGLLVAGHFSESHRVFPVDTSLAGMHIEPLALYSEGTVV